MIFIIQYTLHYLYYTKENVTKIYLKARKIFFFHLNEYTVFKVVPFHLTLPLLLSMFYNKLLPIKNIAITVINIKILNYVKLCNFFRC